MINKCILVSNLSPHPHICTVCCNARRTRSHTVINVENAHDLIRMFTSRGPHGRSAIAFVCVHGDIKCRYPLYIKSLLTYNGLPENLRYYASNFVSSPARPFSRISRYLKVQKHDMFTKLDYIWFNLHRYKPGYKP